MRLVNLKECAVPMNYNNGQRAELYVRYTLTGVIGKADNKDHTKGGDVEGLQVKGSHSTVCKGYDLEGYLDNDGATEWGYVTKDLKVLYIMDRAEWTEFCKTFAKIDRESTKNGGANKLRLPQENNKMREWLKGLE